jgi:hypothetical protein
VFDAPARARAQYHAFVSGNIVDEGTDIRSRFTATGNNGRLDFWRVDRDAFSSQPLHGTGAGTYELQWQLRRPADNKAVDGHSLYLETLAELGIVGLALVLVLLGSVLAGPIRGLRGSERHASAAVVAAGVALLVHAGVDWDWEMPALFIWLFCAGGIAAASPPTRPHRSPARLSRVLAGLACLLLAVTPLSVAFSQSSLTRAAHAFASGDCRTAVDAALGSIGAMRVRPDPYEILGYCDLRAGQDELAVRAMSSAQRRDPRSWRYAYGLAVARALSGSDPRAELAKALRLNPRSRSARDLAQRLRERPSRPAGWRRAAAGARLPD